MPMKPLVLFDIDGTLLKNSIVHAESFGIAARKVYDQSVDFSKRGERGKARTDLRILQDLLAAAGLTYEEIAPKIDLCMAEMTRHYKELHKHEEMCVYPGSRELLHDLAQAHYPLGLVTGNLAHIAEMKLGAVGLFSFFRFGGYGDLHETKTTAMRDAIGQFQRSGIAFSDVVYVCDAPGDVLSAREAGIKVIVTLTNDFPVSEFEGDARPDLMVRDLTEEENIFRFLDGLSSPGQS